MTARELLTAIEARFAPPAWAVLPEVRNGTGFAHAPRTADAIAICTWPSRGLEIHGFEIKVSRTDWLRELKDPAKAEALAAYCDRWWIVADDTIVKVGELPPTWGHLAPKGNTLRVVVEAPKLEPKPLNRLFLAALARRMHECRPDEIAMRDAVERAVSEAGEKAYNRAAVELERLRAKVDEFESVSGLKIAHWNSGRLGEAVRFVLEGGLVTAEQRMRALRRDTASLLVLIDAALAEAPIAQQGQVEAVA